MKAGLYPHLAMTGIKKNRRFYLPFIFTCAGMIMMSYIIEFLSVTPTIRGMMGADTVQMMLAFGSDVIGIFAVIFLFYTSSFLMRRRKREFGLYNILGMGKKNIALLLLWETAITAVISMTAGLAGGMAFSKLAELGLVNLLLSEPTYALAFSAAAAGKTAALYGVIFVLLLLNALRQIHMSDPVELMASENMGEKPPKANFLLGIGGVILMGAAYYMAVTIRQPLSALLMFFVAVAMVIIATYMLFICGSVLLCRILQKNKGYYYKAGHFISVSSMAYRMRRNGAGLASICILATMVLVMITGSAGLYFGAENAINSRYPYDICVSLEWNGLSDMNSENRGALNKRIDGLIEEAGVSVTGGTEFNSASISGVIEDGALIPDVSDYTGLPTSLYEKLRQIYFISLDDYNKIAGENIHLGPDQAMVYTVRCDYGYDSFSPVKGCVYDIVRKVDDFAWTGEMAMDAIPSVVFIVPDLKAAAEPLSGLEHDGTDMLRLSWYRGIDTDGTLAEEENLSEMISGVSAARPLSSESRETERAGFYGTFGGLFFLGIILSIVFIFATTLMIYYKQISEGYEDQTRFDIMQKVGMTKEDIRRSVNSQVMTVFFLPLAAAVCHLAFAFPMIKNLLLLFNLTDTRLLLTVAGVSVLIFAVFYVLVYKITSGAYYNIVSGARRRGRIQ